MSASVDRLLNNARVHLPGALDTVLKLELFNVLADFYDGSNLWREDISVPLVAGTTEYTITPVATASIVRLLYLLDENDHPVRATMTVPGELVLDVAPSVAATYVATVSLTVDEPLTDGLPVVPEWTISKYSTDLLSGLLARMMAQPAKPYSNANLGAFHMRKFRSVVSQAKQEALHRNVNNGQTWLFPQSFATRRR